MTFNHHTDIQSCIDNVDTWCKENNMTANATKSSAIHFSNVRSHVDFTPPVLTLNSEIIPDISELK